VQLSGDGAVTLLNELGRTADAIERQSAHGDRNGNRSVYNYAQYLPERRLMMQAWAEYVDHLRGEVSSDRDIGSPGASPSQSEDGCRGLVLRIRIVGAEPAYDVLNSISAVQRQRVSILAVNQQLELLLVLL
jgi:hypothetical protein